MKRRITAQHPNGTRKSGAPTPSPEKAPHVPHVLMPFPLLAALVEYLKKRPYDEVAVALQQIALTCKNADGTPIEVVNGPAPAPTPAPPEPTHA